MLPPASYHGNTGGHNFTFTLPASFQPADVLPMELSTYSDDCRWLVSTVLQKTAARDLDDWGCVRLDSRVLRRVMRKSVQPRIVRALVDHAVLELAPHRQGVRCQGYRIHRRFLGDDVRRVPCRDPRLLDRILRERDRQIADEQSGWKPIHHLLNREQAGLTITSEADHLLMSLPDHTRLSQGVLVDRIRRQEFSFSVGSTGRVFNSISGLKRCLRACVRLHGQPLGSVDLVNSQPALLGVLLAQQYPTIRPKTRATYKREPPPALDKAHSSPCPESAPPPCSPPPDVAQFCRLVSAGHLYDHLVARTGLPRDTVKLLAMRDLLAKRGGYPSEFEAVFRAEFPTVHRYIRQVNQGDHARLIRALQSQEAELVLHRVAPLLLGRVPTISLHDCLYSRRVDVPELVKAFEAVFRELGFRLSLHVSTEET